MNTFRNTLKLFFILSAACLLCACAGLRPNITIPQKMPPPLVMRTRPKVALVLGSGGAKGYAHIGVIQVLANAGVPIDLIVGASAGSTIGVLYADNKNILKTKRIMMGAGFWTFADISNVPSIKGAMEGYQFQRFLLKNLHARQFNQLKIPLVVATTDLKTGKTLAISSGPIPPAVEASAAIPGLVQPVHLYGHVLVDGAMADPVPVNLAKKYRPEVIIAVNITNKLEAEMPSTALGIYDRAFDIAWVRLADFSAQNADIVIHPKVGNASTFDLDEKWQLYRAGQRAARSALPKIKRLLAEKGIALIRPNQAK